MKKLCPLILCTLFSLSAASIETVDYTQGLSVWFDTPNNLDGQAIWLVPTAQGRIRTKHGKAVRYLSGMAAWERISWAPYPQNESH